MCMQPPLFPSDCEFAQLLTIFQILGTPNEESWPGVTQLKDWCAPSELFFVSMRLMAHEQVSCQDRMCYVWGLLLQAHLSPMDSRGHEGVHG